jgi:hypothetical protein
MMMEGRIRVTLCPSHFMAGNKNEQRAITPKLSKVELMFFCSALLFNEINLPTNLLWFQSYVLDKVQSKGNTSKIRQGRVKVLLQCPSISTYKVSC